MFDAGAIVLKIQAIGRETFERELELSKQKANEVAKAENENAKRRKKNTQDEVNDNKKRVASIEEVRDAHREVGKTLLAVGAATLAAVGLSISAAQQWQSAWAGVQKTNDGTHEQMVRLEEDLRRLATEVPSSHEEIAAVAEAAGQLGIQVDNVAAFSKVMIDLGESTNLGSTEAAQALARFMNVMGTSQGDVGRLGSSVVALGNNFATTESEIVAMSLRLAGAGRIVGLTEGETMGLAAALSSVGIEAEAGGSAISKVMVDIASAVEKGGDQLNRYASIAGTTATDFAAKWRDAPAEALSLVVKGLADLQTSGQSTFGVLEELGITEVRMRDALLRSAAAADKFTGAMDLGNESWAEANALTEEAAKRYATVESKTEMMRNAFNDVAIEMGAVLLPVWGALIDGAKNIALAFGMLPDPAKAVITVGAVLAGTLLTLGGLFLLGVPKVMEYRSAMRLLREEAPKTAGAIGLVGKALKGLTIVGAAASLLSLVKAGADWIARATVVRATSEQLRNTLYKTGDAADVARKALERGGTAWISDMFGGIGGGVEDAQERLEQLDAFMAELVSSGKAEQAREIFEAIPESIDGVGQAVAYSQYQFVAYENAQHEAAEATRASGDAAATAADKYLEQADAAATAKSELQKLLDLINEDNAKSQDAISANADYQETWRKVNKELKEAKKTLDENTLAGSQNADMLADVAKKGQEAAEALWEETGDSSQYLANLDKVNDRVRTMAEKLGLSKEEAQEFADRVARIPTEHELKMIVDKQEAVDKINGIIKAYDGKKIRLDLVPSMYVYEGNTYANGGIKYFANGSERHDPQIARGGNIRVWNEPETGGEAYIPLGEAKRSRSTQILHQVANEFGYDLVPHGARHFANGDPGPATSRGAGANMTININNPIARDPVQDIRDAGDELLTLIEVMA